MSIPESTDPLVDLVPRIAGAAIIPTLSADECIRMFESHFPLGGSWKQVPHSEFDVKHRASFDSLVAKIRELSAQHSTHSVLVVLDALTEQVLQAPIRSVEPLLDELRQLSCGCAVGPTDGSWLADIRMIGSAYLGAREC